MDYDNHYNNNGRRNPESDSNGQQSLPTAESVVIKQFVVSKTLRYHSSKIFHLTGSVLGRRNPLSLVQAANPRQHIVWLFDSLAYRPSHADGHKAQASWQMQVVACVFAKGRKDVGRHVAAVADAIGIDGKIGMDPVTQQRMKSRLQPFLYPIVPACSMTLEFTLPDDSTIRNTLGPTNRDGICSQTVFAGSYPQNEGAIIKTYLTGWDRNVFFDTHFAGPEGWLVISDIDDSIKYTHTSEAIGALRTTFAEEPKPIAGMPEFYSYIQQQLKPSWIYISASPYNLYPFLRDFIRRNYTPGTIMLRESSWKDMRDLWISLTEGTRTYKEEQMDKVRRWFPQRKILCIGDSTQSDPEAYAEMYRKHEDWIQAIFIRRPTDLPHMQRQNSDHRFQKAFQGMPKTAWKVFDDPKELYMLVDDLKTKGNLGACDVAIQPLPVDDVMQ